MKEKIIQYERTISKVGKYSWMLVIDKRRLEALGYIPGDKIERIEITAEKQSARLTEQRIPPRVIPMTKEWKKAFKKQERKK